MRLFWAKLGITLGLSMLSVGLAHAEPENIQELDETNLECILNVLTPADFENKLNEEYANYIKSGNWRNRWLRRTVEKFVKMKAHSICERQQGCSEQAVKRLVEKSYDDLWAQLRGDILGVGLEAFRITAVGFIVKAGVDGSDTLMSLGWISESNKLIPYLIPFLATALSAVVAAPIVDRVVPALVSFNYRGLSWLYKLAGRKYGRGDDEEAFLRPSSGIPKIFLHTQAAYTKNDQANLARETGYMMELSRTFGSPVGFGYSQGQDAMFTSFAWGLTMLVSRYQDFEPHTADRYSAQRGLLMRDLLHYMHLNLREFHPKAISHIQKLPGFSEDLKKDAAQTLALWIREFVRRYPEAIDEKAVEEPVRPPEFP